MQDRLARLSMRRALRSCARSVALALALGVAAVGSAAAASSSPPASTQLSLHAAPDVLSVTVSPASGTFGSCVGGDSTSPAELGFPNGRCRVNGLVITNTGLPGHMMVSGAPMAPVGGGAAWALCGASDGAAASCSNAGNPGADQYQLSLSNVAWLVTLSTAPQCDLAFDSGFTASCAAAPGQSATETARLVGPQSTSNGASGYTTTITWTVAP